jgi:hypothetical protein
MSDCCSPSCESAQPNRHPCPGNGIEYAAVSPRTIIHHLKNPWQWVERKQGYYYCEGTGCDVVYFGEDGSVIARSELRWDIGIKDASADALLCYCFGITRADALSNPLLKDYVIEKTKAGMCSCETSNPSGRCCLKDFPRSERG